MSKKLNRFYQRVRLKHALPALILLFFLFLRLYLYRGLTEADYFFKYDEAIYAMLSQKLINSEFNLAFHPYWNIGFPLVSIPFYFFSGSWEKAQVLVSITSHLLLITVMYLTLRKISVALALVTAYFAAFSPSFTKLVVAGGITEPFYIVLFWLAIYFGWQAINFQRARDYLFSGFFFGLAYLTRTEIIYTLAVFLTFATLAFFLKVRKFPGFNKVTLLSLAGAVLAYLYIPLSNLPKFTTFKFMIFKSTKGVLFATPFALAVLMSIFFERNKLPLWVGLKRLVPLLALLVSVFFLVNLPYILVISKNLGRVTLSGKYSFVGSGHPFTPELDRDTTWAQDIWSIDYPNYNSPYYDSSKVFGKVWKFIEHALEATPKKFHTNLNSLAHSNVFTDFEIALVFLGFSWGLLHPKFRGLSFYLGVLWLGSFVFVSHFMDVAARYVAFSFPVFYLAQAFLITRVSLLFSKLNPAFFTLVPIVFLGWYFDKNYDTKTLSPSSRTTSSYDQKLIGEYLKSEGINLVMARTEGLAFYSGASIIYMPAANPETIIRFAKGWGVEYLVARPQESSWDYMRPIANPGYKNPDLELKHKFSDETLIWKVRLTQKEKLHNFRTDKDVNVKLPEVNLNSQTILKP